MYSVVLTMYYDITRVCLLILFSIPACTRAWQQFLLCFAVNRNLTKLLSSKTSEGGIGCLNGIRVISMTWVILGHVPLFILTAGVVGKQVLNVNMNVSVD